jgi:HAD superfamily hydrolase (TIGR01509 family)
MLRSDTIYRAVLFDMDGVVIDTESAVTTFWEQMAVRYKVELTQAAFDTSIYGCPCRQTLDTLFPHLTQDERAQVFAEEQAFETHLTYTTMPGVVNLLIALREHNIPAALVTSGEQWKVDEVMRQLGIGDLFATYVTAENVIKGKPHPACYALGAQRLNTPPEYCIAFEDSISGVQAATAAGTCCIGVRPERTASALLTEGARGVIPDFVTLHLEHGENRTLNLLGIQNITLRLDSHLNGKGEN